MPSGIQIVTKNVLTKLTWIEVKGCMKTNKLNYHLFPLARKMKTEATQQGHIPPSTTEVSAFFAMKKEHEETYYT